MSVYQLVGDNPTLMYLRATEDLLEKGEQVSPRGKLITELRPACLEFENPYNRVTFLEGRRINPFFQIAESLWILSGRADVEFLAKFNENIKQFSDDGKWFNAPYGERIRMWNKNAAHNIIINPVDQLADVYRKLLHDKDTRQAVIVISNPMFDNAKYTIGESGKDISCNLVITFKIRRNKLHMTVFNRSNDLHWGVFGANLCQFSTLQEVLLSWLKADKYPELEMGNYDQITDSLHIYLDDYGYKITNTVLANYKDKSLNDLDFKFEFPNEPRMSMNIEEFDAFLAFFWNVLNPYLMDDEVMKNKEQRDKLFGDNGLLYDVYKKSKVDDYWCFAVRSMVVYRLVKLGLVVDALKYMKDMPACQWKVSMMYFLKHFILKLATGEDGDIRYQQAAQWYLDNAKDLLDSMKVHPTYMKALVEYLELNKTPG